MSQESQRNDNKDKLDKFVTEPQAVLAKKAGALEGLRIVRDGKKYYLMMRMSWSKNEVYLCSTRVRDEPRYFKDIGRLIEYIDTYYPTDSLVLTLKS